MTNEDTQRLVSVLDAMEEGIYIVNQDYTVEFMNKAMVDEFGYGIGKKCYEMVNKDKQICEWCGSDEVFNKGKSNRSELQFPDSDKIYDLIELPLRNTDGSVSKLAIYRDITQRKKREEKTGQKRTRGRRLLAHANSVAGKGEKRRRKPEETAERNGGKEEKEAVRGETSSKSTVDTENYLNYSTRLLIG